MSHKPGNCSLLTVQTTQPFDTTCVISPSPPHGLPKNSRILQAGVMSELVSSGLDSFTASEVMEVVKSLVSTGMTIAATIHTPTSRTFQLFDRILILQRGRIVYFGNNGDAATSYFTSSPYFKVLCCAVPFKPYILLCCAVLCCAVLCCAVLRCAVLRCAVLGCAVLCCAVLCCAVLCCAFLCCAGLCCAARFCAGLYLAVLCCVMTGCAHVAPACPVLSCLAFL